VETLDPKDRWTCLSASATAGVTGDNEALAQARCNQAGGMHSVTSCRPARWR